MCSRGEWRWLPKVFNALLHVSITQSILPGPRALLGRTLVAMQV